MDTQISPPMVHQGSVTKRLSRQLNRMLVKHHQPFPFLALSNIQADKEEQIDKCIFAKYWADIPCMRICHRILGVLSKTRTISIVKTATSILG
jgi:hypothetical protein